MQRGAARRLLRQRFPSKHNHKVIEALLGFGHSGGRPVRGGGGISPRAADVVEQASLFMVIAAVREPYDHG